MKDLQRLVVSTRCQKIAIKSKCGDLDNQDEFSLNKIVPIETVLFDLLNVYVNRVKAQNGKQFKLRNRHFSLHRYN